jgi:hypothetical protein
MSKQRRTADDFVRDMKVKQQQSAAGEDRPLCGAKTRAGGTCLVRVEFGKARCRFHGGLSTGPKTEAGRAHCRSPASTLARLPRGTQRGAARFNRGHL